MSIQLGILHILASRDDGFATVAAINADVRLLSSSDWSRKLRSLAKKAGPINIFSMGLVIRESRGWRITDAGRQFIAALEAPPSATTGPPTLRLVASKALSFSKPKPQTAAKRAKKGPASRPLRS